jgi:hypothetical protein
MSSDASLSCIAGLCAGDADLLNGGGLCSSCFGSSGCVPYSLLAESSSVPRLGFALLGAADGTLVTPLGAT